MKATLGPDDRRIAERLIEHLQSDEDALRAFVYRVIASRENDQDFIVGRNIQE